MKLGIVIKSKDAETVWNAFRLANLSLNKKDKVKIFLLAKGVEYKKLSGGEFDIISLAEQFTDRGGEILACGTCLKMREDDGGELCPVSTLKDFYRLIQESEKIVSF